MSEKIPQPRGRRVLAKTCDKCGHLKPRDAFSGMNASGKRVCKACLSKLAIEKRRAAGGRPKYLHAGVRLLAATCPACGELRPGDEFRSARGVPVTSRCRECIYRSASPKAPDAGKRHARQYRAVRQEPTLDGAAHHGHLWTGPELETIQRSDLSDTEAALLLGRTYNAVRGARERLERDPKWWFRVVAKDGPSPKC